MRYWKALAFCQHKLCLHQWRNVSLDEFSSALECTRRNTQLVIKRLVKEEILDWRSGVGRGNLPSARLRKDVAERVERQANRLIENGQIEHALSLIGDDEKDRFLSDYLSQYQSTPQTKDVLKVPFYRATHDLDPIETNRRTEHHIANYLYSTLLKADDSSAGFSGDLAHAWRLEEHALSITLRKGLKFHDGTPLYAQDVHKHFQRLMASPYISKALYQFIDEVEVDGLYKIRFVSHSMPMLLPKLLAHCAMGITKQVGDTIFGCGPFVLSEQNEWLTLLTVNTTYHGHRPWIDGIEIWNMGDKAKDFELNSHVVHGSHLRPAQKAQFTSCQQWEQGCVHAMLNPLRHPWMKEYTHRAALQDLLLSMGKPTGDQCEEVARATGMVSEPNAIPKADLFHIASALERLPKPTQQLTIMTYQLGTHIETAKLAVTSLTQLGIDCILEVLEYPEFNHIDTLSRADIIITGEVFSEDTEMSWLGWLLCTNSNEACLSPENKTWLLTEIVKVMHRADNKRRLDEFEKLEKQLIAKGIYQPLFHVKQDLNISNHISAPELLANGWIDFSNITM